MDNQQLWIDLIQTAFKVKKAKNPRYSYRAFSRDLEVSQSLLSKLLAGRRKVTTEVGFRVALGLGLPNEKIVELMLSTLSNKGQVPAK